MKNKYHARKIKTADGIFDSKKEYNRWIELSLAQKAGVICDLRRQVRYNLIPSQKRNGKVVERPVDYVADFEYIKDGQKVVEDTKGMKTRDYIIKRKLMLWLHGVQIREV